MTKEYTDLDYWEDLDTVRNYKESIESTERFLQRIKWNLDSDRRILAKAEERLAAHPEFKDQT